MNERGHICRMAEMFFNFFNLRYCIGYAPARRQVQEQVIYLMKTSKPKSNNSQCNYHCDNQKTSSDHIEKLFVNCMYYISNSKVYQFNIDIVQNLIFGSSCHQKISPFNIISIISSPNTTKHVLMFFNLEK